MRCHIDPDATEQPTVASDSVHGIISGGPFIDLSNYQTMQTYATSFSQLERNGA